MEYPYHIPFPNLRDHYRRMRKSDEKQKVNELVTSGLEGTVDIQELTENSLTSLLELLKDVFITCKDKLIKDTDAERVE